MSIIEIYEKASGDNQSVDEIVELDHLQREKGRFKALARSGTETRVFLERGHVLKVGERLLSDCGKQVEVAGALEDVTTAHCSDWQTFSKVCYHLGNRHVKLQVGELWLRIKPDHVLEEMLLSFDLRLEHEQAIFAPESGAYAHGTARTHAGHSHAHHH